MHNLSDMSNKELKQYIKLYKKIHCLAFSKLDRPALLELAHNMRQHEASAKLTDEQFEAHMASLRKGRDHVRGSKPSAEAEHTAEPKVKAPRKSTENQERHRKLFGEWRKSKTALSWKDWLVQHGTSKVEHEAPAEEKKKPVVKKRLVMPKEEEAKFLQKHHLAMPKEESKKKPVVKKRLVMPKEEPKKKPVVKRMPKEDKVHPLAPTMKVEAIQKTATDALVKDLEPAKKKRVKVMPRKEEKNS